MNSRALYVSERPSRRFVRRLPASIEVLVVRSRDIAETLATRETFDVFLVDIASGFAASFIRFVAKSVYQPYVVLVHGRGYNALSRDFTAADSIISDRPTPGAVQELEDNIVYPELYLLGKGRRGRITI